MYDTVLLATHDNATKELFASQLRFVLSGVDILNTADIDEACSFYGIATYSMSGLGFDAVIVDCRVLYGDDLLDMLFRDREDEKYHGAIMTIGAHMQIVQHLALPLGDYQLDAVRCGQQAGQLLSGRHALRTVTDIGL